MNSDFRFALYVFCADYHSGQNSRLYRILSRMRVHLSDNGWRAIRSGKYDKNGEWEIARRYYRELIRKYSGDTK